LGFNHKERDAYYLQPTSRECILSTHHAFLQVSTYCVLPTKRSERLDERYKQAKNINHISVLIPNDIEV
jgi:hypothetical protein